MLILRKIVFYILAITYIISCPLLIFYALGYIFVPKAENSIVKTGNISIATLPQGASIYMNGKLFKEKTPAVITELLPDRYSLKIEMTDYVPWTSIIPVDRGKAVAIEKLLLIPTEWKKDVLIGESFKNLVPLQGTCYFVFGKTSFLRDYAIYDCVHDKKYPLINPGSNFGDYKVLKYFSIEKSTAFIIQAEKYDEKKLLWFDITGDSVDFKDITYFFKEIPSFIKWDTDDKHTLFALINDVIDRVDLESGEVYPKYLSDIRGYGILDRIVYAVISDSSFISADYEKKDINILLNGGSSGSEIYGDTGAYDVMPYSKNIILFIGEKGDVIANHLPYYFVDRGVIGTEFDRFGRRILLWKKDGLGILDFSKERMGDVTFEVSPQLKWIFTGGKDISQAFWMYDGSHVLFRDENSIFLADLQPYGEPTPVFLFNVRKGSSVSYNESDGKISFLDPGSGNLVSVFIVPGHGLIKIPSADNKIIGNEKK